MKRTNQFLNFLKFFKGESSKEDTDALLKWIEEDKKNRQEYFMAKRLWLESLEQDEEQVDRSWERLQYRLFGVTGKSFGMRARRRTDLKVYALVASLALLLVTGVYTALRMNSLKSYEQNVNHVETPFGSRTNIILPDGTEVWLNSGSKLTYPTVFSGKNRVVNLSGEAFFDVKKYSGSEFIVRVPDLDIRALGTQFNVKSYPDEDIIETFLLEGKVVVDRRKNKSTFKPITLKPRQKLTFVKDQAGSLQEQIDKPQDKPVEPVEKVQPIPRKQVQISHVIHPDADISWKDEKLVIYSETLLSLSRKLERYYNIEIEFQDEDTKNYVFSGTLDEVTIDEVMRAISVAAPISFSIEKNKVTLCSAN